MERLRIREAVGAVLFVSLGFTACSDAKEVPQKETTEESVSNEGDVRVRHEYTPTGKRITTFESPENLSFNQKLGYCEGTDLVEETDNFNNNGGTTFRSVNHPACDDGRLDPEDFDITAPN